MENILSLNDSVKVAKIEGDKILILSDYVKILLDDKGNLVYVENLVKCKGEGVIEKVEKISCNKMYSVVSKFLQDIGIPANIKGYHYLRTAILLSYENEKYLDAICNKLYPKVAELHDTAPLRVERAIRHAIEVAWERGNAKILDELFPAPMQLKKSRSTNSQFIATIVEKLKND